MLAERRAQLRSLVEPMGLLLGATGTHPWADWKKQRIIDTPHYRRNDEYLRYVVWRNNTFGLHVHVAINGPDRAIAVVGAMRNFLPELLALSASSPFVEGVNSGLHSARTQIFTRFFPRCGVPDAFSSWAEYESFVRFLYDTGSITEHTQIWWSVRPHLAFPTVEIRICDGQPELAEAQSLAAFAASLTARVARAYDDGEPVEPLPHRLIEENFWRAIRYGLSGELIDFARGEPIPARQRLEELIEWVQPVAEEIGAAPYLAVPGAERGRAADRALRGAARRSRRSTPSRSGRPRRSVADEQVPSEEELREALDKIGVADILVNALSAAASIGFRRVSPEARDLEQVRLAIESLRALEPVLRDGGVDDAIVRDLEQARMNLQLAYAKAVEDAGSG